jgi:hypothetical protein
MRTRPVLKVLGLSALVMGVMVIGTARVAQAETGACFGYKSGGTLPCFSASLEAEPRISLAGTPTFLVGGLNMEISCMFANAIEGGTLSANGSILLGRMEFSGCFTRKSTATGLGSLPTCAPVNPLTGVGRIRTEKGFGLIVLHNGEPVIKLSPDSGTTLAKIFLDAECPIAEEIIVTGSLVLQDVAGKIAFEGHAIHHFIQEFPNLKLMKVGANTVTIDGMATVSLGFAHFGLEWAGKAA